MQALNVTVLPLATPMRMAGVAVVPSESGASNVTVPAPVFVIEPPFATAI